MKNSLIKEKLAAAYRIVAHLGLDDHTYTHLSARAEEAAFFIYPFGLRFNEVTTSNLLKVSLDGTVLEGQEFQYNRTGYIIHGSIYQNRADVNTIFHLHTPEIVAVSACEEGLLPLSQWALHFYGKVSYHNYDSLALENNQGQKILQDLGDTYVMLLRNHGALICGTTLEEAMFYTYHLQQACKTQCLTLSMNQPLIIPSDQICKKAVSDLLSFEEKLGERDWRAWLRLIN